MDLINRLNRLGKRVHTQHHTINWGGCCVYAARVAEQLSKYVPTRVRVGQGWEGPDSLVIDEVRPQVQSNLPKEWNKQGLYFAHVVVEFEFNGKVYHYDALGVKRARPRTNMGDYPIVKGHLTIKEARELAAAKKGWNSAFDRDEIPAVHRLIDDAFDRMAKAHGVAKKTKKK